ncbi:MAG: MFS transporter [Oscillospiraceae bacterium]|jgi:predicted MFS family arabinose efflux permease
MSETLSTAGRPSMEKKYATIYCMVISVVYALAKSVYSTLLPSIIDSYGLTLTRTSLLEISESIGSAAAMLVAMLIADKLDRKRSLIVSSLLYGGALLFEGAEPVFTVFLLMRLIAGFCDRYIDSVAAAYMSDIYSDKRARVISILHLVYSLGMLIAPSYAAWMLSSTGRWSPAYRYVGIVFIVCAAAYALTELKKSERTHGKSSRRSVKIPYREMLRSKQIWALILYSFFGGSMYYTTLIPTYLENLAPDVYTVRFVSVMLTAGTLGNLASRFVLSIFSQKLRPRVVIPSTTIGANILLCASLFFLTGNRWVLAVVYTVYSFLVGANYTLKFILACSEFPEASATVLSATSLAVAAGNIVLSRIIGIVSDSGGYLASTAVYLPCMIIAAIAIIWGFSEKKSSGVNKAV